MEKPDNKTILEYYHKGWKDCAAGIDVHKGINYGDDILKTAYEIGGLNFWAGDDVSSVDLMSEEEILYTINLYNEMHGRKIKKQ